MAVVLRNHRHACGMASVTDLVRTAANKVRGKGGQ
jgi:hypothetical protein